MVAKVLTFSFVFLALSYLGQRFRKKYTEKVIGKRLQTLKFRWENDHPLYANKAIGN